MGGAHLVGHKENGAPIFRYGCAKTQKELIDKFHQKIDELRDAELTTGLRRGEICGFKWADFDEVGGKLNINRSIDVRNGKIVEGDTKTGKDKRSFYLPVSTANVLRERKKNAKTEWIFTDPLRPEFPVAPLAANRKMKQLLPKAGLPNICFHDLWYTFANTALANGMDVKTLSALMGHISSETTLNIYTHITDNMQRSAVNKIEQGFGRNEGSLSEVEQTRPSSKNATESRVRAETAENSPPRHQMYHRD